MDKGPGPIPNPGKSQGAIVSLVRTPARSNWAQAALGPIASQEGSVQPSVRYVDDYKNGVRTPLPTCGRSDQSRSRPWLLSKVTYLYCFLILVMMLICIHASLLNRGSYMSAHVLLNLLNELGKREKMRGLPSILSLFRNEFNKFNKTRARM